MLTVEPFQVWRLPLYPQTGELSNGMTLCFAAKEKKQKSESRGTMTSSRDVTINNIRAFRFSHAIGKEEGEGPRRREGAMY